MASDRAGEATRRDIADFVTRAVLAFSPPERGPLPAIVRWSSAPAATLFVAIVQYSVFPEPSIAPFVFLYVAIAVSAGLGGRGPGLLCVLLSASVANHLFMPPHAQWSVTRPALTATGLFLLGGTLVALVCASFRTSLLRVDVTARELDRRGELLRLSHDAILVWRLDGVIEFWNQGAEQLYGFSSEEALGRAPHDLLHTAFPRPWLELRAELRERLRWHGELTHATRDGRTVVVSTNLQLLRGEDGVERVLEANRDITERKRIEDALRESEARLRDADRRKNDFLGVLSHELRNPLAPIRNSLYILARAAPGGEQARRALAVIDRQVLHTTRLVDDLLDVTRIGRGKVRLQRERVDLGDLARRAVEDHRDIFERNGVRLALSVGSEPVVVSGDAIRIAQIIGNLLQNAVKFTPRGGVTALTIEQKDGVGVVTARDTGAGIAPDVLPRVFEPFVQAESTLERSAGGLGLGLALVKGLAELHGGSVSVQSEGAGKGATFTVRLPLERRKAPRLTVVPAPGTRAAPRRVLVVEDNIDAAETLQEALELDGHVVDVALTGVDGIEKVRALTPDVVVCDIGLPGMNGFEVARSIREDPSLGDVTLIALSGYAQPEDVERSKAAGFDLHLAKPLDMEALERAIALARGAPASAAVPAETKRPGRG